MSKKQLLRGLLGLIIMMTAGGCSSILDSNTEPNTANAAINGPIVSFYVGSSEFTGSLDKQLSEAYRKGNTIQELLRNSGIVVFTPDGKNIHSVSDISLEPRLKWELTVEDKTLGYEDWDHVVDRKDHIGLVATSKVSTKPVESLILFLNGTSEQPELTHSYVLPYSADSTVRSLLIASGFVQLSENNKSVLMVNEYTPLTDEVWGIKVNGKLLMDNGMDMKLRPQDEVEVVLNSR